MSILVWLIVGGLSGWLASLVTGDDPNMGIIANIVVGIVGAFIAGTLIILLQSGTLDFTSSISGFNLSSIIVSFIGAVVLLLILKAFRSNRPAHI